MIRAAKLDPLFIEDAKGAAVNANTINANVDGQLAIESVQDAAAQQAEQSSAGGRVQISIGTAWEASGMGSQFSWLISVNLAHFFRNFDANMNFIDSPSYSIKIPYRSIKELFMSSPKKIIIVMATVTALAALLTACGKPAGMGPPPAQGTPVVSVITLQSQSVALTSELPGRINAVLSADVRPQITGLVRSRNFVEGSDVKAGSLLYEIDPATYRATYNNAKASLDKAVASLHTARLKAQRYQELVKIQAVSEQDNDDMQATLQQDEADVEAAQASLDTAKINLDFTRITAPISGRIGKSSVTAGALVT
eukprot:gene19659-20115_t